ncbi:hypothetical protein CEP53_010040 [Fusarium sp. AF-6]|nr:hypothetical protein CEP53_010040 [Fusarium sp. AF-6]
MHGLRIDEGGKEEVSRRLHLADTARLASMCKHIHWHMIFKNWSSNEHSNPAPVWRDVRFTETSIQVGVLRDHHPEPGSGGVIPQLPLPSARAAGAPAMLSLTLNLDEESYAFLWRDTNCKFINPKYVKLDDGYNTATARAAAAVEHHDSQRRERIVSSNIKLIVSAARHCIH